VKAGMGARLCPQGQPQRAADSRVFGFNEVLRLVPLRGTQPRSVRIGKRA